MKNRDKALLGAAVAGILGAMAAGPAGAAKEAKSKNTDVQCLSVNACKGKSSCSGAQNGCEGQNSCKGKGWVKMPKEACEQIGGTSKPLSMNM